MKVDLEVRNGHRGMKQENGKVGEVKKKLQWKRKE
jgi:hypothetical protein